MFNMNNFDNILKEEQGYASLANKEREKTKKAALVIQISIVVIAIYLIFNLIQKIKKDKKELKNMSDINSVNYPYYRELPDKNMTAGDIAYIYYYKNDKMNKKLNKVFSANVLSLFLKGCIGLEKNNKKEIVVTINKNNINTKELLRDENTVFNLFADASKKLNKSFTMKEFKKYITKQNAEKTSERFEDMKIKAEMNAKKQNIYALKNVNIREKYKPKYEMSLLMLFVMLIIFMIGIGLLEEGILATILCLLMFIYEFLLLKDIVIIKKILNKSRNLSEKGMDYLSKLKGLKRYIEDFSFMKERETMDIVLWREYLVAAVVFGVSNKVIKELLNEIPQIPKETYECYMCFNKENVRIRQRANWVRRFVETSNSNYSSGEGFGGGFSSGGGRWSVVLVLLEEDKILRNI